jgi:hypothetical protein
MNTIIDNTDYYTIILTAALVGVTIYYAIQTRRSVHAVEKSTKTQFKPFIKSHIKFIGPNDIVLELRNIGKGPARDLEIDFQVNKTIDSRRAMKEHLLIPEDFKELPISLNKTDTITDVAFFKNNLTQIDIIGKYKDIFNKTQTFEENLNVTEYLTQFDRTIILYNENPLKNIARSLESIKSDNLAFKNNMNRILRSLSDR